MYLHLFKVEYTRTGFRTALSLYLSFKLEPFTYKRKTHSLQDQNVFCLGRTDAGRSCHVFVRLMVIKEVC